MSKLFSLKEKKKIQKAFIEALQEAKEEQELIFSKNQTLECGFSAKNERKTDLKS